MYTIDALLNAVVHKIRVLWVSTTSYSSAQHVLCTSRKYENSASTLSIFKYTVE